MPLPSVRLLTAAVQSVLDAHPVLVTHESVVQSPETTEDGHLLRGYAVFHPGGGDSLPDNLAHATGRLLWTFQVSCVGETHDQIGWVIDEVRELLDGLSLSVAGTVVGRLQPPLGYQPPPPRPQHNVTPPRLMVPLQYQVLTGA